MAASFKQGTRDYCPVRLLEVQINQQLSVLRWWNEIKTTELGIDYIAFRGGEDKARRALLSLVHRWTEQVDSPSGLALEDHKIEMELVTILDSKYSRKVHN